MILDTSFLIDIQNEESDALGKANEIDQLGVPQRIPGPVVHELFIGVGKGTYTEKNRERVERVLRTRDIVPLDGELARVSGRLDGELRSDGGAEVGIADTVVAAVALGHDEPVVTDNEKHFRPINGVRVETY